VAALLAGCVYVPRTIQVYDAQCGVMANHMELEGGQVAAIQHCENQGCVALVVGASVVTAATIVISGTIVVAGNVAYWFERKAHCQGTTPGAPVVAPTVAPSSVSSPVPALRATPQPA